MPPIPSDIILLGFLFYCLLVVHRAGHLLGELLTRPHESRHRWPRPLNGGGFWHLLLLPAPGSCSYIAETPIDERQFRHAAIVESAAGPAANLALGVALLIAATMAGAWRLPLLLGGLLSLLLAVWYGNPRHDWPCWCDGRIVLDLIRSPGHAHRLWTLAQLGKAFRAGVRPRDWDDALLAEALATTDGTHLDFTAADLAVQRAIDMGDGEAAAQFLQRILRTRAKPNRLLQMTAELQAAYVHGFMLEEADLAGQFLNRVLGARGQGQFLQAQLRKHVPLFVARAEAAVLFARREYDEAARTARQALALRSVAKGQAGIRHEALERERLEALRSAADQRAEATDPSGSARSARSAAAAAEELLASLQ